MTNHSQFEGQVVIVTGAGNGLGRCHALAFAEAGARVVVNDLGIDMDGQSHPSIASLTVVDEIRKSGGEAIAEPANVADAGQVNDLVARVINRWGRVDVLVCNAGILRDKSFTRMTEQDFRAVIDVHLVGAFNCVKAVWALMREQAYGRILLTTSASGLIGNFGQANYAAAKAGMVGLMNSLHIEGEKYDIRVNCLAPTAVTSMTEDLLDEEAKARLDPSLVSPAALHLTGPKAPSRYVMGAGAGAFSRVHVLESTGVFLDPENRTPEGLAACLPEIESLSAAKPLYSAFDQTEKFLELSRAQDPPESADVQR